MGIFGLGGMSKEPSDILLFSISFLSRDGIIQGRKKLMKLMFLLEHLDIKRKKLVPDKMFTGNNFIIYKYGPFSFQVMDDLDKLKKDGCITEENSAGEIKIKITESGKEKIQNIDIGEGKIERLEMIKNNYCNMTGKQLEDLSLKLLGIKKEDKEKIIGIPVTLFLSENE